MAEMTVMETSAEVAKALRLIGLARRAGNLGIGTEACRSLARCNKAKVIILATGCSENTAKRVRDTAIYHKIQLIEPDISKEALGAAVGKSETAAVAVGDKNLAIEIKKLLILSGE